MKLERVFLFALCIGCLFWLADDASAATIHVRQDGTGDADNIQDGIDMADVADTVLVHDSDWNLGYSDYSGNGSNSNSALEIPSSKTGLTLKGYGDDRVSLNAYARYGDYENHAYVLHVAADNVKVENFRFRENYGDYYSSGVKISGDDVTLDDVRVELSNTYTGTHSITITGTSGFSILDSEWYATDSSYWTAAGLYGTDVSDVTFEGSNQIVSNGNTGIYLKGNGTQVISGTLKISSASIQNYFYFESVTVTGAIFSGNSGLTIVDAENVDVTGNTYNMTSGTALTFQNTKNVTIHNEEITKANTVFSVTGSETDNFRVSSNTFANLGGYAIYSSAPEVTIQNNKFRNISNTAIYQSGYYNLTISDNTFRDCGIAVEITSTDSFTISDNVMSNNRIRSASGSNYGVYLTNAEYGTITGNKISQFDQAGLFYSNVNVITTTDNDIFDNGWGVLISGGDDTRLLHINGNDIYDNHNYGIYTNVHVDATGNYWGSNDGPYPYGSGNGVGPIEGDILAPLINIEGYTEESQTGQDVGGLTDRIMGSGTTLLMLAGALLVGVVGGRLWGRMAGNGYFSGASFVTAAPPSSPSQINSRENPTRPQTQEEFEALSSGTWYVNPEDGEIHQK